MCSKIIRQITRVSDSVANRESKLSCRVCCINFRNKIWYCGLFREALLHTQRVLGCLATRCMVISCMYNTMYTMWQSLARTSLYWKKQCGLMDALDHSSLVLTGNFCCGNPVDDLDHSSLVVTGNFRCGNPWLYLWAETELYRGK